MMKKIVVFFMLCLAFQSCKNTNADQENAEATKALEGSLTSTSEDADGDITLRGNFIYYEDAAVFQTPREIYGVVLDDKAKELADVAKPYQTVDTDMVKATLRVKKIAKPQGEEGWDFRVEIQDILKVEALNNTNNTITLEQ